MKYNDSWRHVLAMMCVALLLLCPGLTLAEEGSLALVAEQAAEAASAFEGPLPEGKVEALEVDLSGGYGPWADRYVSDVVYEDPSIRVQIETYTVKTTRCIVARVKIAEPSQLRTAPAYDFNRDQEAAVVDIANRVNAVAAINGDYYSYWRQYQGGYLIRQGTMYLNKVIRNRDVLLIDDNGDFTIVQQGNEDKVKAAVEGRMIVNSFNFGPGLIVDGQKLDTAYTAKFNMSDESHQRSAICQVKKGEMEYILAVCEGLWTEAGMGLTLNEWVDFLYTLGVENAYNLDGGNSTALIFHGEKLNEPGNPYHRKLSDIIYFASAYAGGEE